MTKEEIRQEIKEINARLKAMKHTRPKLIAKCRENMASNDLSDAEKIAHVGYAAESFMEDNSRRFREMREVEALQQAMEDEHTGTRQRPTYCPECSTWSPSMPPEYEALCDEWRNTFVALRDKVAAAILKGKAA